MSIVSIEDITYYGVGPFLVNALAGIYANTENAQLKSTVGDWSGEGALKYNLDYVLHRDNPSLGFSIADWKTSAGATQGEAMFGNWGNMLLTPENRGLFPYAKGTVSDDLSLTGPANTLGSYAYSVPVQTNVYTSTVDGIHPASGGANIQGNINAISYILENGVDEDIAKHMHEDLEFTPNPHFGGNAPGTTYASFYPQFYNVYDTLVETTLDPKFSPVVSVDLQPNTFLSKKRMSDATFSPSPNLKANPTGSIFATSTDLLEVPVTITVAKGGSFLGGTTSTTVQGYSESNTVSVSDTLKTAIEALGEDVSNKLTLSYTNTATVDGSTSSAHSSTKTVNLSEAVQETLKAGYVWDVATYYIKNTVSGQFSGVVSPNNNDKLVSFGEGISNSTWGTTELVNGSGDIVTGELLQEWDLSTALSQSIVYGGNYWDPSLISATKSSDGSYPFSVSDLDTVKGYYANDTGAVPDIYSGSGPESTILNSILDNSTYSLNLNGSIDYNGSSNQTYIEQQIVYGEGTLGLWKDGKPIPDKTTSTSISNAFISKEKSSNTSFQDYDERYKNDAIESSGFSFRKNLFKDASTIYGGSDLRDYFDMGDNGGTVITYGGDDYVVGGSGADVIYSSSGDEVELKGGDDVISTSEGRQEIDTGDGNDSVTLNMSNTNEGYLKISLGDGEDSVYIDNSDTSNSNIFFGIRDFELKDKINFARTDTLTGRISNGAMHIYDQDKLIGSIDNYMGLEHKYDSLELLESGLLNTLSINFDQLTNYGDIIEHQHSKDLLGKSSVASYDELKDHEGKFKDVVDHLTREFDLSNSFTSLAWAQKDNHDTFRDLLTSVSDTPINNIFNPPFSALGSLAMFNLLHNPMALIDAD